MKAFQIEDLKKDVSTKDMSNVMHVKENGDNYVFNIMRTVYLVGLDDIPKNYFSYYEIMEGDTWPLISFKLYDTIELWWLLLKMNNVKDPTFEPTDYGTLRYISKNDANEIINTIRST